MSTTPAARPLPIRHKNEPCCGPVEAASLTPARLLALAERLKALADPTRLAILDLLAQQPAPLCVCDITPLFTQTLPPPFTRKAVRIASGRSSVAVAGLVPSPPGSAAGST